MANIHRSQTTVGQLHEEIRTRILEGTLEAIGRSGLRKLGMTDVAVVAGVSRGTLYRYFASKEALLEALFEYERHRFEGSVNELLSEVPPGLPRLEAHIDFMLDYLRHHPALAGLIETEPRYVLGFLASHYDSFRKATGSMLEPILRESGTTDGTSTGLEVLSDLLLRVLLSFFLFPPNPKAEASSLRALSAVVTELAEGRSRTQAKSPTGGRSGWAAPVAGSTNGA